MVELTKIQKEFIRSMELKLNALKTLRFHGIRDNLTPFLRQFTTEQEKYTAYKIIDLLIYYNSESLKEYVRYILNELRRRLYIELVSNQGEIKDEEYEIEWKNFLDGTIFIPLSDKGPADSAYQVLSKLKEFQSEFGINERRNICYVQDIVKEIKNGAKRIYIIDDFVGSGFQIMTKFLPNEYDFTEYQKCKLSEVISSHPDVHFEFFILSSSEKGQDSIKTEGYNFSCIDLYTSEFDILVYNDIDWNNKNEFNIFLKNINKTVKKFGIDFEHTLNLPVLFDYSSPKPSHPVYWNSNNSSVNIFKPLRRRQ